MEGEMIKLYFEEIPVVDDDDDVGVSFVDDGDTEEGIECCRQKSENGVDVKSRKKVLLSDGGVIQSLDMNSFGNQDDFLETNIMIPVGVEIFPNSNNGPDVRGSCSMCVMHKDILVFGGARRDGMHFDDLWRIPLETINSNSPTWENIGSTTKGSCPSARSGHTATVFNSTTLQTQWMVLFGGLNAIEQVVHNDLHVLQAFESNFEWIKVHIKGTYPQARTEHAAVAVGDQLLVFGGSSPHVGLFRDLHVLDLTSMVRGEADPVAIWSTVRCGGVPPIPREMHSMCFVGSTETIKFSHYGLKPTLHPTHTVSLSKNDESDQAHDEKEKGNAMFVKGDFQGAVDHYTKAIHHDPKNYFSFGNRSACHLSLGNAEQALEDALSAIRIHPCWAKGYYREAAACAALGAYDQVLTARQAAIECSKSEKERTLMSTKILEMYKKVHREVESKEESTPDFDSPVLVIYGGRGPEGVLQDIVVLDLKNMTWQEKVIQTPMPRCGHTCSLLADKRLFVTGGWDGQAKIFNTATVYDLNSKMWTECNLQGAENLPSRFSHGTVVLPPYRERVERIAVFGGVNFEKDNSDLILFDIQSE